MNDEEETIHIIVVKQRHIIAIHYKTHNISGNLLKSLQNIIHMTKETVQAT